MAISPEYQQMIDEIMSRYGKLKSQAEASGIGEAQRRGLINQAGTSDLEFAIRKSKVDPYASAEASEIAGLLGKGAEREAGERYGTSEREASQKYGTAERLGSQDWQTQQNQYNADLQKYLAQQQNALQQQQIGIMNKQADYRPSNWQTAIGGLTSLAGGFLGGFCFDKDTLVKMEDGTAKRIMDIQLGDKTLGGEVQSIRSAKTSDGSRYNYLGVIVTDRHAVKESGKWVRIKDSQFGVPIKGDGVIYSLVTSKHRIYSNDIEFADEIEVDNGQFKSDQETLDMLNKEAVCHTEMPHFMSY